MSEEKTEKKEYSMELDYVPPELKKAFPDYPCIDCTEANYYRCNRVCQAYKDWRSAAWEKVTNRLKRSPK